MNSTSTDYKGQSAFYKGPEHLWIFICLVGPGTNVLCSLRDDHTTFSLSIVLSMDMSVPVQGSDFISFI